MVTWVPVVPQLPELRVVLSPYGRLVARVELLRRRVADLDRQMRSARSMLERREISRERVRLNGEAEALEREARAIERWGVPK